MRKNRARANIKPQFFNSIIRKLRGIMLKNTYEKMLYAVLLGYADKNSECFPSIKTLALDCCASERTVQRTLKTLAEDGMISIQKRKSNDGGNLSNLYVVYDVCGVFTDNPKGDTGDTEDKDIKKESPCADQSNQENPKNNEHKGNNASTLSVTNNTVHTQKSQPKERISIEELKAKFDYDIMSSDENADKNDIDAAINILHRNINSNKATVKMGENYIPGAQFREKLMQLTNESILYAIKKFRERKGIIKNPEGYLLSILYRANEQYRLYVENHMRTLFGY